MHLMFWEYTSTSLNAIAFSRRPDELLAVTARSDDENGFAAHSETLWAFNHVSDEQIERVASGVDLDELWNRVANGSLIAVCIYDDRSEWIPCRQTEVTRPGYTNQNIAQPIANDNVVHWL